MQQALEHRRNFELNDDQARLLIYEAFLGNKFPIKLMKSVDHEFFEPKYEEFKTQNSMVDGERVHFVV